MTNMNRISIQYEANALENIEDINEIKELNILIKWKEYLLNELDDNEEHMFNIRKQIEQMEVSYTYSHDGALVLLNDTSNSDNTKLLSVIVMTYNDYKDKNSKIRKHINHIESIIKKNISRTNQRYSFDDIEKKGLNILQAQEMERSRIACDLHDSVVQNLTTMVHKTEICIKTMEEDPIGVKLDLQLMSTNIRNVINDIRCIIFNLRPMAFDDLGLDIAIQRFLEKFKMMNTVDIIYKNDYNHEQLKNSVVSLTIYRIIQEACSNAVYHGHASKIKIALGNCNEYLILGIDDNGKGFNPDEQCTSGNNDNSGFGLSIMKERIYLLSGSINIKSREGMGTSICVKIPIKTC